MGTNSATQTTAPKAQRQSQQPSQCYNASVQWRICTDSSTTPNLCGVHFSKYDCSWPGWAEPQDYLMPLLGCWLSHQMKHNVQKTKSRLIDDILLGTYDVTLCLACTENTLATWKHSLKQSVEVDLAVGELVETPLGLTPLVGYIGKDMNRLSTNQVCILHQVWLAKFVLQDIL